MSQHFYQDFKLGILGGGQLGRMLIQAGTDLNIDFRVMDPDAEAPCSKLAAFTHARLTDFEKVISFGEGCDVITIEIENVNTRALHELVRRGKKVYPQPGVIEIIQDKRTQKQFYRDHNIPTAEFVLTEDRREVAAHSDFLPAVNKLGKEGYDGRGVQVLRSASDLGKAFDAPGLLERLIEFDKEISVIVARNEQGNVSCFPAVEMVFHPEANLVEHLLSPARLSNKVAALAETIARQVAEALGIVGLLAVEMFVTKEGDVLVNESAPRPHNSGHQTIEANVTSQYQQHLRAILGLPLGDASCRTGSAMVNLLGEEGYAGNARYDGLEKVLALPGVYVHLYGKKVTRPFRKMGHVTIVDDDPAKLHENILFVRSTLKVRA
jgi:5-(carboxyamino)imidazole ribonucleotide synthase